MAYKQVAGTNFPLATNLYAPIAQSRLPHLAQNDVSATMPAMSTIWLKPEHRPLEPYAIDVAAGILANLGPMVRQHAPAPSCGIVSDSIVAKHHLAAAVASLQSAGYRVVEFVFPAGEANKTLATVSRGLDCFLAARLERKSPIVALGGGVVGDLAGFIAATLLRGVPFVQVPTSLLAAVDASVGGKVGVDHAVGKNLIGAFHQPRAVICDVELLRSLPDVELRCGLAECVKHGIIRDVVLLEFIAANTQDIFRRDAKILTDLIAQNVRIKAAIVSEDPFEHGVRALLNLGHTFGHALEVVIGYENLKHGEAVALGTVAAAHVAVQRKMLSPQDAHYIERLLQSLGLPTRLAAMDINDVLAAMAGDKKVVDGRLRLILPTGLGAAVIIDSASAAEVRSGLEYLITGPICG